VPPEPSSERTQALRPTICGRIDLNYQQVQILDAGARVFIQPKVSQVPLTVLQPGAVVTAVHPAVGWFQIEFSDARWGKRVGFIECSRLGAIEKRAGDSPMPHRSDAPLSRTPPPEIAAAPPAGPPVATPSPTRPSAASASTRLEKINGYLEWRRNDSIIVDGQSIRWNSRTRLKTGQWGSIDAAPLGVEVTALGGRSADGAVIASAIELKPNGVAMFEREVRAAADAAESLFIHEGAMLALSGRAVHRTGRILETGPEVERVKKVLARLMPPYMRNSVPLRVHVVETSEWNAMVFPNGSIWVFSALLDDLRSDDELAAVLGHELAHFTHEHGRRARKQALWQQLAITGANAAIAHIDDPATRDVVARLGNLGLGAWSNGYGRNQEDQADRVGLRYAYEAGFDVRQATEPWRRLLQRQGEEGRIENFFSYNHSRPSDRIRNIDRQIALNYN